MKQQGTLVKVLLELADPEDHCFVCRIVSKFPFQRVILKLATMTKW